MMKHILPALLVVLTACGSRQEKAAESIKQAADTAEQKPSFFPVTSYLKGQVYDIRQKGLTPIKYTTVKEHTDSVMIKFEDLDSLTKEFLQPEIDSTNLTALYTETKFLDRTVNAFTFTYEAKNPVPDSLQLLHWDVYIEPESGKVKRIFMVKKISPSKTLQLTWLNNEWFKTTTIINKPDGSSTVEKEEKISWDY